MAELSLAELGVLLTLFQPEGADYAHHITGSTPRFGNLTTALICDKCNLKIILFLNFWAGLESITNQMLSEWFYDVDYEQIYTITILDDFKNQNVF